MKKLILLFCLSAFVISATTRQVRGVVNNTNIRWKIQAIISSTTTVTGDVIRIPAGKFILDSNITCTKKVSIKGEGIAKTVLYRQESTSDATLITATWGSVLIYTINSTSASDIVVSNIEFRGQTPSDTTGDGGSLAADNGLSLNGVNGFRITHCKFKWFGTSGISVVSPNDSIISGLIDYCYFQKNVKLWKTTGLGLGYGIELYATNTRWVWDSDPGSSRFVFIEKCTFDLHRNHIASNSGSKYCARNSIFINGYGGSKGNQVIDGHDPNNMKFGTRCIEFYNNYVYNAMAANGRPWTSGVVTDLREIVLRTHGEFVMHDNYMKGFRFGFGTGIAMLTSYTLTGYPYGSGSATGHTGAWTYPTDYPATLSTGYLSARKYGTTDASDATDHIDDDAFIWNNTWVSMDNNAGSVEYHNYGIAGVTGFFVVERDYHLHARPGYSTYTFPHPFSASLKP